MRFTFINRVYFNNEIFLYTGCRCKIRDTDSVGVSYLVCLKAFYQISATRSKSAHLLNFFSSYLFSFLYHDFNG